jgi:hypothetical protein
MKAVFSRVFTLEVDGRPTLAFEAARTREAQQICKESWLRGDLTFEIRRRSALHSSV